MDQICLVVPILPGSTADAKDFKRELEAGRNAECALLRLDPGTGREDR